MSRHLTKTCARDGCEVEFEIPPKWRGAPKKYCSEGCRTAAYQKRAYWANLEASRAKGRRKYHEHREARREARRRRYWQNREQELESYRARVRAKRRLQQETDEFVIRQHERRQRELALAKATASEELLELIEEQEKDSKRFIITKPWERSLHEPVYEDLLLIDTIAA